MIDGILIECKNHDFEKRRLKCHTEKHGPKSFRNYLLKGCALIICVNHLL